MLKVLIIYLPQLPRWHIILSNPPQTLTLFRISSLSSKFPPFAEKFLFVLSPEEDDIYSSAHKETALWGPLNGMEKAGSSFPQLDESTKIPKLPKNKTKIPKSHKIRQKLDQEFHHMFASSQGTHSKSERPWRLFSANLFWFSTKFKAESAEFIFHLQNVISQGSLFSHVSQVNQIH